MNPLKTDSAHGLDAAWSDVCQFQRTFGLPVNETPTKMSSDAARRRSAWMKEELEEFLLARDLVSQVDAITDLIYLALGVFAELGVPPGQVFATVHRANLAKVWADGSVHFDDDGKVVKPVDWHAPEAAIREYLDSLTARAGR